MCELLGAVVRASYRFDGFYHRRQHAVDSEPLPRPCPTAWWVLWSPACADIAWNCAQSAAERRAASNHGPCSTLISFIERLSRCARHRGRASAPRRARGRRTRAVARTARRSPSVLAADARAGLTRCCTRDDDLTVLHVVWAPGMSLYPARPPDVGRDRHLRRPGGQRASTGDRRPALRTLTESGGKDACAIGDIARARRRHHPRRDQPAAIGSPPRSTSTAATSSTSPAASGAPGRASERPYDMELARQALRRRQRRLGAAGADDPTRPVHMQRDAQAR